ncbi:MAG: DUF177 domain-containing protein [Synechococcus sp.]
MLRPIPLKDLLQAPNRTRAFEFKQDIANFDSLIPVDGSVSIAHRGNFVEVSGQFSTIVTLDCYRCLNTYNHRLQADVEEIIWLEKSQPQLSHEVEVGVDDLVETLDPDGVFDIEDWAYQQLCLSLPQKQICAADCSGVNVDSANEPPADSRWSALQQLKQQLS